MGRIKLSRKDLRKQAIHLANNGLNRQAIFDEMNPRFRGREVDIADIVSTVFLPHAKKKWIWTHIALVIMVGLSMASALLYPIFYYVNFALLSIYMMPVIVINGFFLYGILSFNKGIVDNMKVWSFIMVAMSVYYFQDQKYIAIWVVVSLWAILGYAVSRIAIRELWGIYKHSAHQVKNKNGQIIAVSKIQFLN